MRDHAGMQVDNGQRAPADSGVGDPAGRRKPRELSPIQRALGLLTRREHSRQELTRKLLAKGVTSEEVDVVVTKLAGAGWQDDVRFAESRVRVRVGDGYGPLHIRAELASHGLNRDAIAGALATFEGDWGENARNLVRRRYGERVADDLALQRKAAALLMRRGFDSASIRAATRLDPED